MQYPSKNSKIFLLKSSIFQPFKSASPVALLMLASKLSVFVAGKSTADRFLPFKGVESVLESIVFFSLIPFKAATEVIIFIIAFKFACEIVPLESSVLKIEFFVSFRKFQLILQCVERIMLKLSMLENYQYPRRYFYDKFRVI